MNNPPALADTPAHLDPAIRGALTPSQQWIVRRFPHYARACLIALTFLAPVVVDVAAREPFSIVKLTVIFVLTVFGLMFCVMSLFAGRRPVPRPLIGAAIAVFLLTMIGATAFSEARSVSIFGLYERYGGFVPYLLYAAVAFLVLTSYEDRPSRLVDLAWASAAASLVVSGYVLIQAAGLDWVHWTDTSTQQLFQHPASTLGNSNFAGGYLAIVIPLVFGVALLQHRVIARWSLLTTAALDGLALWLTGSRGGLVAVAAAGLAITLIARPRLASRLIKAGGVMAIVGVVVLMWHPGLGNSPATLSRLGTSTLESRLDYWLSAVRIVRQHPVTGTGPDTYYAHYARERVRAEAARNPLQIVDKPHNVFLEHAVNGGIPEGLSFLLVFGLALYCAARRARELRGAESVLPLAGFGALVAYCAQAFFSIDQPPLAVLGWILIGWTMVVADARFVTHRNSHVPGANVVASDTSAVSRRTKPVTRRLVRGTIVATAATLLFYGVRPLLADVRARSGHLDRAIQLSPQEASYFADRGDVALTIAGASRDQPTRLRSYQDAERYYKKALDLRPEYFAYIVKIADINAQWGFSLDPSRFAVADSWWRRAIAENRFDGLLTNDYLSFRNEILAVAARSEQLALADPTTPERWIAAADAYDIAGNPEYAKSLAAQALSVDPANKRARDLLSRLHH